MEGSIKISSWEFNQQLFEKLQHMIETMAPKEIIISFSGTGESKSDKKNRFLSAKKNLEQGKGISYTINEIEALLKS